MDIRDIDRAKFSRDLEALETNYAWQVLQRHIGDEILRASLAGAGIAVEGIGHLWKIAQYQGRVQGFKSVLEMPNYLMRGGSPSETSK